MKVLILADGTSVHSIRILDWHLRQGCDVTFVDYADPKPLGAPNYRFVPYPGLRGARFLRRVVGRAAVAGLNARAAARALRRIWTAFRPDIVHLYQIDARAYHCFLARIGPMILSSWGTDINQHFATNADAAYRRRTARALAAADLIIADADDILEKCVRLAGRPVPTARLLLGVDTELFRPGYEEQAAGWRMRMAVPPDARLLFSIRALTPLYGHHQVLEAFARAQPTLTAPSILVFKAYNDRHAAGYQQRLRDQAERLGVSDRIRFADGVAFEELPVLYAAADLIVNYPSIDGFPVTFLEAAACERPVVSNRLTAYRGSFAEKYFQLVEPDDVGRLAEALARAVNGFVPTGAALHEARVTIEREFSEQVVAGQLMTLYRRTLAERKAR